MKRFILVLLIFTFQLVSTAQADWRWAQPVFEKRRIVFDCGTMECIESAYKKARRSHIKRIHRYDKQRLQEWRHWTSLYIPDCTWYGESGTGPEYAPYRYTMPNSLGSGALGKFQMMPGTYHSRAKYHDWSPLDQEIASRMEYWANGTGPWENC
jgi:hypothetical protein